MDPYSPFTPTDLRPCPLFLTAIAAGFPSPAENYIEKNLDLNEHLIAHHSATFFVRVAGHSMRDRGIHDGDILIVDRALPPRPGHVVVAVIDGELTLKELARDAAGIYLKPANPAFPPLRLADFQELLIWGVAIHCIHKL